MSTASGPGVFAPLHLRSMIYAPGNSVSLLDRVFQTDADSAILDLEDAVPDSAKSRAREMVARALDDHRGYGRPVFVRVNSDRRTEMLEDLRAVVGSSLAGIRIPKVESASQVLEADECIGELEARRGLRPFSIRLIAAIESALGVHNVSGIATASKRVWCLSFGAVDFALDTNSELTADGQEALFARSQIVIASRVAGLAPPFDSVYPMLDDEEGLVRSASAAKRLGYQGKALVHPKQIAPVHSVFTPSHKQISWARRVIDEFARSEADGRAAFTLDGVMIDYPVVHQARSLLRLAELLRLDG